MKPNAGSKRKNKLAARDARRVKAVNTRLNKIYQLSKLIESEEELDRFLTDIPDDAVRAETRKLIEPFLIFPVKKVTIAGPLTPDVAPDTRNGIVVPFPQGSGAVN